MGEGRRPFAPGTTIEFSDAGPDEEGRRRFTLTWPIEPRLVGFPSKGLVLQTHQGQCSHSVQWREFIARGAKVVGKP